MKNIQLKLNSKGLHKTKVVSLPSSGHLYISMITYSKEDGVIDYSELLVSSYTKGKKVTWFREVLKDEFSFKITPSNVGNVDEPIRIVEKRRIILSDEQKLKMFRDLKYELESTGII
ncbi:hypothetical protein GCM10011506_37040 [Marivirga lumbricoides]|uniref:Uncharacterized protein n=1 Tax=Marivirga lumbricoides TaxID=1046115 RepID=A0ABQ1MVZ0_9BACT|nr:hypothetical protein GCM10011506_37040 [Marivirga lumbricoides]